MEIIKTVFYFILVIGVLVTVHEWGHFIAARLSGIRADIFSFGMGKRLFGWHRKSGFTFGELPEDFDFGETTDWRVSLIPMGGYVKVVGMVDESFDTEFENKAPEPWEFRSKNAFLKAFVLSAGVIMNMILAIVIFIVISFTNGTTVLESTTIGYVKPASLAEKIGLKDGDKVEKINNKIITDWNTIFKTLSLDDFGNDKTIQLVRNGKTESIKVSGISILDEIKKNKKDFSFGVAPFDKRVLIVHLNPNNPGFNAGLKDNDTVISLNNTQIHEVKQFMGILTENKGKQVAFKIKRGIEIKDFNVTTNSSGKIGTSINEVYSGKVKKVDYTLVESISEGWNQTTDIVNLITGSFAQIFKGNVKVSESVAGPIMIAKESSRSASMGFESFFRFMAMISISLAIMNILPFPALDGGHLVFVLIEAIIRREVPIKVKMYIQNAGMAVLLLLFAYVIVMDIIRL
jgi:regulator of sigma E protease